MFAEAVRGVDYGTMMEPNFSNHASAHKECTVNMLMEIAMMMVMMMVNGIITMNIIRKQGEFELSGNRVGRKGGLRRMFGSHHKSSDEGNRGGDFKFNMKPIFERHHIN